MTPAEMKLMREMLREEIQPVRDEQVAQGKRIEALEEAKKSHSLQVRAITKEQIPRAQSEAKLERKGDNEAIGVAFDRMAAFMNDLAETAARIEQKTSPVTTVAVPDGKGGTSVRPASLIAAESSVRTEVKQDGLAKVVLDTAIDTTLAKNSAAATKNWQKRVTTPLLVLMPVAVETVRYVWPLIFPHVGGP